MNIQVEETLKKFPKKFFPEPYILVNDITDSLNNIASSKQFDARPSFNKGTIISGHLIFKFRYIPMDYGWEIESRLFSSQINNVGVFGRQKINHNGEMISDIDAYYFSYKFLF